ncbi:MAG: DUF5661 family protein [Planctomycetota bacterium]|jgi:hypothetical protein
MELPEYVTTDEVKRVCKELGLSDWTELAESVVPPDEAAKVLAEVDKLGLDVDPEEFRKGLEVELEHGIMFPGANVSNNHPVLTGMIVMAHFKETLDYYRLLEVAELEGDMLKAAVAGDAAKLAAKYAKLVKAREGLAAAQAKQIG